MVGRERGGLVWCGVVWCGVIWCGGVLCGCVGYVGCVRLYKLCGGGVGWDGMGCGVRWFGWGGAGWAMVGVLYSVVWRHADGVGVVE